MFEFKKSSWSHQLLRSQSSGEEYSSSQVLVDSANSKDFFVHHEIVQPGRSTSAPHFHKTTDEFVYVTKGEISAIEGDKTRVLSEGDCVCFSAASGLKHQLRNTSEFVAEVLIVKRNEKNDVVF